MKRVWCVLLSFCLLSGIAGASFGAERGTAKEAEAMVKKAVAYIKTNGKEKAFAEFNNPKGQFISKDLYISVSDMTGKNLAHGQNIKLVGKDLSNLKDADGKLFYKERIEIAKSKGKGWQDYKFTNPISKTIEQKATYLEKYEDLIVTCGVYK